MPLHVRAVEVVDYSSPANATVGSTTTELVAANPARKYLAIINASDEEVYLAVGANAVMNKGIYLAKTGGSFEMVMTNRSPEAVNGICTSGSKNVTVQEAT